MGSQRAQLVNSDDKAKLLRTFKAFYSLIPTCLFKIISPHTPSSTLCSVHNEPFDILHAQQALLLHMHTNSVASASIFHVSPTHSYQLFQIILAHCVGLVRGFPDWSTCPQSLFTLIHCLYSCQSIFHNHVTDLVFLKFNVILFLLRKNPNSLLCTILQLLLLGHPASFASLHGTLSTCCQNFTFSDKINVRSALALHMLIPLPAIPLCHLPESDVLPHREAFLHPQG